MCRRADRLHYDSLGEPSHYESHNLVRRVGHTTGPTGRGGPRRVLHGSYVVCYDSPPTEITVLDTTIKRGVNRPGTGNWYIDIRFICPRTPVAVGASRILRAAISFPQLLFSDHRSVVASRFGNRAGGDLRSKSLRRRHRCSTADSSDRAEATTVESSRLIAASYTSGTAGCSAHAKMSLGVASAHSNDTAGMSRRVIRLYCRSR